MLDIIIRNARLFDGAGNPWFWGELGIKDGKIALMGHKIDCEATKEIDAMGGAVCPGFIDIHAHSDFTILIDPRAQSKVQQGITTELNGQCGGWAAPLRGESLKQAKEMLKQYDLTGLIEWSGFDGYFSTLTRVRPSINQAILVGHGTVRGAVMGYERRPPTSDELHEMKVLVREAMEAGAYGMSTGLYYAPGSYSETPEVTEMCKVVARLGGIHASHLRDESDYNIGLVAALQEVIDIASGSGVSTQVSHLKALGPKQWGKGPLLLKMIDEARAKGLDITCDQYPYPASGSSITGALLPRWAQEGGRAGTLAALGDPARREKVRQGIVENLVRRGGPSRLLISGYPPERSLQGKTLAEVASLMGLEPADAAMDLLAESDCSFVCFVMSDEDVELIMQHPAVMVGTDGYALAAYGPLSSGHPHPRSFGTHPRILGHHVREKRTLGLENAIRKMTSCPAQRLGLSDRGLLKPGLCADVVLFDPDTIIDTATFENPQQYPKGIMHVIVNGTVVVENGKHQNVYPGQVLRRKC